MAIKGDWFASTLLGRDGFHRSLFTGGAFARKAFGHFDDFCPSEITSTTTYAGQTVTAVGASTLVMADALGGSLQLTSSAVENEGIQMQSDGEIILPAAGKDIWFEANIATNDPIENDLFIGLCLDDTSIIASNPQDVIGFWTHDGDANLDFEVSSVVGGAAVDTGTDLAANTFIRLGFHVRGITSVTPYINGVAQTAVAAANIPAVELAISFACLAGEGVSKNMSIDWYRYAQIR